MEKSIIVDEIWGKLDSKEETTARLDSLVKFLERYEWERQTASRLFPALQTSNADIQGYIRLLKRNCRKHKHDIWEGPTPHIDDTANGIPATSSKQTWSAVESHNGEYGVRNTGSVADNEPSAIREDNTSGSGVSARRPDKEALHLALRVTFLTACVTPSRWSTTGQGIFRPTWKDTETLADFITRVYPMGSPPQESRPMAVNKLSAAYLQRYASVQIKWTDRLSDHLTFMKGADWKSLYVFAHPAWLKTGLDTLEKDDIDLGQTTEKALELWIVNLWTRSLSWSPLPQSHFRPPDLYTQGCLPPLLLRETLLTLHLLFPNPTTPPTSLSSPQSILAHETSQHNLDPYFTYLSTNARLLYRDYHTHPSEAASPTTVHSLYARFPYWADRLHALWCEADDPSPVTAAEHWAESKRNPRFAFWCAGVGICIALACGVVTAVLAAVQVWMAFCTWVDDGRPMCGYRTAVPAKTPG